MTPPANLLAFDRAAMERFFADIGEPPFRAKQVLQWLYRRRVTDIDAMTDLAKPLRARLRGEVGVALPEIVGDQTSADGTRKWLLKLADGNCIETVFIPEPARGTLCVSSQVGCALNCSFCATARQGFNRNLRVDEIIGQVWVANAALSESLPSSSSLPSSPLPSPSLPDGTPTQAPMTVSDTEPTNPVTNVVMMGMGEPLLNFDNVVAAMNLMLDDFAFGLSRRRVTLSTTGVVPAIDKLAAACPVSLAVSLHAPDDDLRDQLVPLNRKYPLAELLAACRRYADAQHRRTVTFEYVMLRDVNDGVEHAQKLAKILGDVPAKVNLIPFNPYPGIEYERSYGNAINRFRDVLLAKNIFAVTRKTRGDDIDAACGQLAGKVQDRTRRSARLQQVTVQQPVTVA